MLLILFGCVQDLIPPYMGDCAQYPEERYDFGQIDIGSCISGPTDFKFVGSDDDFTLLISNANPYLNFTSGSFMGISWRDVQNETDDILIDSLDPQVFSIPSFAAPVELIGTDKAMVGVRYSEGASNRVHDDSVHVFNIQDPNNIQQYSETVTVKSDPVAIEYDKSSGLAFVANRTSHDISIIDSTLEPMEIVPPWPLAQLGLSSFDGSGNTSMAKLSEITEDIVNVVTEDLPPLTDDHWTYEWVEGTYQIWIPDQEDWIMIRNQGDDDYQLDTSDIPLSPSDFLLVEEINKPFYYGNAILFAADNKIYSAIWSPDSVSWEFDSLPLVDFGSQEIYGFSYIQTSSTSEIIYSTQTEKGWSILKHIVGTNQSEDIELFSSETNELADPTVIYEESAEQWRMIFAERRSDLGWQLREATSLDTQSWDISQDYLLPFENREYAAPVFTRSHKGIDLWYSRLEEDGWRYANAFSSDGITWEEGESILDLRTDEPTRIALHASPNLSFRLSSEEAGIVTPSLPPAVQYIALDYGWTGTIVTGMTLDTESYSDDSSGGVQVDSISSDYVFTTLSDRTSKNRIALALLNADRSLLPQQVILEDDNDSLYSPVVWETDDAFHMIYTRYNGTEYSLEYTKSEDGLVWPTGDTVLQSPDPLQNIEASSIQSSNGTFSLWLAIEENDGWNIYTAITQDLSNWDLDPVSVFPQGSTGAWDDNGVRDPVIVTGDTTYLLYSGFDGSKWEIGYAEQLESGWARYTNPQTNSEEPILEKDGLFHTEGVRKAVPTNHPNEFFYAGFLDGISRVGRASGNYPTHPTPAYWLPSPGDTLRFSTEKGSEDILAIPLDTDTEDLPLTGVGLGSLSIDTDRGFLYAASKLLPYIIVIDIRDDSDETFTDRNYLDIEATLAFSTSSGAIGFRQVLPHENYLYAINDAPESIFIADADLIEDNAVHDLIRDPFVGLLPAPRGDERDEGAETRMSIGPGQLALHPNGSILALSNFNTNSISIYNLSLGPHGQLIDEIPLYTENPYSLIFSPDGLHLVVGAYTGEIDGDQSNSLLITIDTDPTSSTYLNIQNRIVNQ